MTTGGGAQDEVNEFLTLPSVPRRTIAAAYGWLPEPVRVRVRPLARRFDRRTVPDDAMHPERLAVLPHLGGSVLEVGCAHRKTVESAVAVDLVPGGQPGTTGNARAKLSQADVAASGDALPFRARSFDTVLARHNLEHYIDLVDVLGEWRRILRHPGRIVLVVPDEDGYDGRTVELDPTHYHAFTRSSLTRLVEVLGFRVLHVQTTVERWSFLLVASTTG